MEGEQKNMKIPAELIPRRPECGGSLTMNLRCDDKLAEDEVWIKAVLRYDDFLKTRRDKKILFLELGVGYNTPVIIKYPFWMMSAKNSKAVYACVNYDAADVPL